jgi:glucose dehydrogenase
MVHIGSIDGEIWKRRLDYAMRREISTLPRKHQRLRWSLPLAVVALAFCVPCAPAQESQYPRASDPVAQPTTRAPMQAEMDSADIDPDQWLTSNKGYLGYRYSALAQINTENVGELKAICSFELGEEGSFQGGPLVYDGILYITSAFGTFVEKIESAPVNGRASEASNPQDVVHRHAADRGREIFRLATP